MIKFLKYINSIPFPFTMKHYQTFGDTSGKMKNHELTSVESWDVLRKEHPRFSISPDREEWLIASEAKVKKDGQDADFVKRAEETVKILRDKRIKKIFSVGVGGAGLEYQIKKMMPGLRVVCSEYSDDNVELLKKVFIECDEIIKFDVLKGDWVEINRKYLENGGLCLIYRIDASFNDNEWRDLLNKISSAGVQRLLVIPTGVLTMLSIFNRKKREIKWFFEKTPILFSGFIRTKKRFQSYWKDFYVQEEFNLGGLKSFLLTRKL